MPNSEQQSNLNAEWTPEFGSVSLSLFFFHLRVESEREREEEKKKFMYLAVFWQIRELASTFYPQRSGSGIPLECTPH